MGTIHAIIKKKGTSILEYKSFNYSPDYSDKKKMADFHNYVLNLTGTYIHCLLEVKVNSDGFNQSYSQRAEAVGFENKSAEIRRNYNVIALSHRNDGFTHFDWDFGSSVSFHIYSNFGYGSASKLESTFKYKDVILASYSNYTKYASSTFAIVTNCTKFYAVNYSEWEYLMKDCLEFYDAITKGKTKYILEWLDKQLDEMVTDLEKFVTSDSASFRKNNSYCSQFTTLTGDDFWIIKSRKISNALEFVENIKCLPKKIDASRYTNRLVKLCKSFRAKLKNKIKNSLAKQSKLEDSISNIIEEMESNKFYEMYSCLKMYKINSTIRKLSFGEMRTLVVLFQKLLPKYTFHEVREEIVTLISLKLQIGSLNIEKRKINDLIESLSKDLKTLDNWLLKYSS